MWFPNFLGMWLPFCREKYFQDPPKKPLFFFFWKVSYVHQGYIYLLKKYSKHCNIVKYCQFKISI